MNRTIYIAAFSVILITLLSGCAGNSAPKQYRVSHAKQAYVVVITPSNLSEIEHAQYAALFMDGFTTGLRGELPTIHFHPSLKPAVERGWSDGNNQGLREYGRHHMREFRENFPGLYDNLQSEGFKPDSQ